LPAGRDESPVAAEVESRYIPSTTRGQHERRASAQKGHDFRTLIASTAAARVNGYLAGSGSRQRLESEIEHLGLSQAGRLALLNAVTPVKRD